MGRVERTTVSQRSLDVVQTKAVINYLIRWLDMEMQRQSYKGDVWTAADA